MCGPDASTDWPGKKKTKSSSEQRHVPTLARQYKPLKRHNALKKALLTVILTLTTCLTVQAQDDVFYRLELGAGVGGGFGLNDVNSKFFGSTNLAGGLIARFPLNPRMAVKGVFNYMKMSGSTDGIKDFYPATTEGATQERLNYELSGSLFDLCALYELHFLPYGWAKGYQGFKRLVPYIQFGLGMTYTTPDKAFTMNIPIGLGLKWKVKDRINIGLDWTIHFTPSDKLDGLEAPHGIKSSEFRNKDHYSLTMLTFTYDLSPKCAACNKD